MQKTTINNLFNITRIVKALSYALSGIRTIFINEVAFKQEILITLVVIPFGFYLGATTIEKVLLVSCWFLVLILEAINSAVEAIVDRISLEIHPMSKKIKDISAAAVLLTILNAIIVWTLILSNK